MTTQTDTNNYDVITAINNTDVTYLAHCLAQRQPGPGGAGSRFLEPIGLEQLETAAWVAYDHPAVEAPAKAYKAPIPGRVGLIEIATLDGGLELTLDDRKSTGFLEIVHSAPLGPIVGYTTLLVGPDEEDAEKLVVWTFFPGDPISPSKLETEKSGKSHGDKITVGEAYALGFRYAKVE